MFIRALSWLFEGVSKTRSPPLCYVMSSVPDFLVSGKMPILNSLPNKVEKYTGLRDFVLEK